MSMLDDARSRVVAVLEEIDRLKQSEFPYSYTHEALDLLKNIFKHHQSVLGKASESTNIDVLNNVCRDSLRELHIYVPILGFLLRSTNVRNAFEIYGPLQRIVYKLMGDDKKLILSSEWEFSPFVYRAITGLSSFVLVGLPAPESSNPFILPLAGHELGHSIWEHYNLSAKYERRIYEDVLKELTENRWDEYKALYPQYSKDDINDGHMFAPLTWRPAYTWSLLQIEEMFCDFLGVRLFAESFLYAFAYLLSPGTSGQRSLRYPNIKKRVSYIVQAANEIGISTPKNFESLFVNEIEPTDPTTKLLLGLADNVSESLIKELMKDAVEITEKQKISQKNPEIVKKISNSISTFVVPIKESQSLVDIINAGWDCKMSNNLWEKVSNIERKDRNRILMDIVLKSMEISEIYDRLEKNNDSWSRPNS